jgi:hypothetical protein
MVITDERYRLTTSLSISSSTEWRYSRNLKVENRIVELEERKVAHDIEIEEESERIMNRRQLLDCS